MNGPLPAELKFRENTGCCWQIQYFEHLERKSLLPKEQKECRRNSQGTKDQLFIAEGAKKALEWSGGL